MSRGPIKLTLRFFFTVTVSIKSTKHFESVSRSTVQKLSKFCSTTYFRYHECPTHPRMHLVDLGTLGIFCPTLFNNIEQHILNTIQIYPAAYICLKNVDKVIILKDEQCVLYEEA